MSTDFTLPDSLSLDDLHTYLGRAAAVDDGATRLIGAGGVLAAYVGVLAPAGLLDSSPTVLGLRTFALRPEAESGGTAEPAAFDVVVPIRAVLERLTRLQNEIVDPTAPIVVPLPPTVTAASWAAISPPRGGWSPGASFDAATLDATAKAGIDEVARVIPEGTGEQIVHRVRSEVWSRPIENPAAETQATSASTPTATAGIPAGAAFASLALGFLSGDEPTRVFTAGSWTRLSTSRGHVLVKRRTSLL